MIHVHSYTKIEHRWKTVKYSQSLSTNMTGGGGGGGGGSAAENAAQSAN